MVEYFYLLLEMQLSLDAKNPTNVPALTSDITADDKVYYELLYWLNMYNHLVLAQLKE